MSNFPPPPTSSPPPPTLLAEIHRAAKVSFCPSPLYPSLLAAGTIAGTIDDSFETRSSLELYDLALSSSSTPSPPVLLGSLTTKDCFHSVAWGIKGIGADLSHGLIAGGMSDGAVNIWNAAAIIKRPPSSSPSTPSSTSLTSSPPQPSSSSSALLSRSEQHKGQVHALQFHPTQPNLLASGASDGVVLVWDLADVRAPRANKPNPALTGHEHGVTCVGWNKKVPQIVASSSETGETTVWDLRQKKSILKFRSSSRTPVRSTALVWNPEASVQLAVVYANHPVAEIWDLRQSMTPKIKLEGFHTNSILGVDWCPHDARILLTTGEDGRMGVWDPIDGHLLTEYQGSSGGANYDVVWSPSMKGVFATSSFDAYSRVSIQSLPAAGAHVPSWLTRPSGGAFAFGGKFVSVAPPPPAAAPAGPASTARPPLASAVTVSTLQLEPQLLQMAEQFQSVLQNGAFVQFCDYKKDEAAARGAAGEEERVTWTFMKILFEAEQSQRLLLIKELGFDPPKDSELFTQKQTAQQQQTQQPAHANSSGASHSAPAPADLISEDQFFNQSFSDGDALPSAPSEEKNGVDADGTNHVAPADPVKPPPPAPTSTTTAASSSRKRAGNDGGVVYSSFDVLDDDEAEIRHALIYGDFTSAVQRCLQTGRLADAIIFSSFGPSNLWEETRAHYFSVHPHPFIRNVMKNVSSSHLEEMVASSPLLASDPSSATSSWKETLAILITYTTTERYRALVNQLAERLEAAGQSLPALICYMCSSNVDRSVELFSRQLVEAADPVVQLHTAMEKIAVFAMATSAHLQQPPSTLLSLKYSEYATLLASQGFIVGAWNYLKVSNPSGTDPASAVLLDRLFHASYASDQPIQQQPPAFPFHPIVQVGVDVALAQVEGAYEMSKRNRQALVHATQQHQHAGPAHHTPQMHPQPHPQQSPQQYPPAQPLPPAQPGGQYGVRPGAPQQYAPAPAQPGYPQQQPGGGQVHPPTPYPPGVYNPAATGQPNMPSQPYSVQPYRPGGQPQPPPQQQPQQPQMGQHPSHPAPAQGAYPGHPQQPQPPQPQQPRQPYNPQAGGYSQPPPQQPQYPQPPSHGQMGGHAGSGGPAQLNYPQPGSATPAYPPQPTAPPSMQAPRLPPPQQPLPPQHPQQPSYPPQQPAGYHAPPPQPGAGGAYPPQQSGGGGAYPPPGQPPAGPAYPPHPGMAHPSQQPHPSMPQPGQPGLPPPHMQSQQPHDLYNQQQQQPPPSSNPQVPPPQPRIFNPAAAAPAPPAAYQAPQQQPAGSTAASHAAAPAAASAASLSSLSFSPECQQLVSVLESHYEQLTQRAAPSEQRKISDLHHRLLSLYVKLALPQSQSLSPSLLGELSALCQCALQADYNGCKRHHTALVKNDWTGNNEWILALKSFLDLFKKYLWVGR